MNFSDGRKDLANILFNCLQKRPPELFCKKSFLKISQISQEKRDPNTGANTLTPKPVKFAKFLRTPILKNICERLLLYLSTYVTFLLSSSSFVIMCQ